MLSPGLFKGKTTYILGNEKNAGKTTVLNCILSILRGSGTSPAFLSIGVDGESHDTLSGKPKPPVFAENGDMVITTESALLATDCAYEILESFKMVTVLGRLIAVRVSSPGRIELIGPENNQQLGRLLEYLRGVKNDMSILIDGAFNRKTQMAAAKGAGYIYVSRITAANMKRGLDELKLLFFLDQCGRPATSESCHVISGALTAKRCAAIPRDAAAVILEDFTRVFLDYPQIKNAPWRLYFKTLYEMRGVIVTLCGTREADFLKALGDPGLSEKLIFKPYQEELA